MLLRAALLHGNAARDAYAQWRKDLDIDDLEFGSQRVLPILCSNLRAHGIADPLMPRFHGIGRYAWYMNHILIGAAQPLLQALGQAGIPLILLKGMALVAAMPEQMSLRAMTDIDLLVRPEHAAAACDLLADGGWRPCAGNMDFVKCEQIAAWSSCEFTSGRHRQLDLHWFAFEKNRWPEADEPIWSRAIAGRLGPQSVLVASFEDQVLHACVHGAPWNGIGTLRWATDSTVILRARGAAFDWRYFLDQCCRRGVVIQVRNCLDYLERCLDVPIPREVLAELRKSAVSLVDAADYRWRARNPVVLAPPVRHFLDLQDFRAASRPLANGSLVTAFRAWIRHLWAVDSALEASALALLAGLGRPPWLRALVLGLWGSDRRQTAPPLREPKPVEGLLDLSLAGDPRIAPLYGWSPPQDNGRWTDGAEAALSVDVGTAASDLRMTLAVCAFLPREAPDMRVEVWVQGRRFPDWRLALANGDADMHQRVLRIPKAILAGRLLRMTFVVRQPRSPRALGLSSDRRRLGLFLHRLTLGPLAAPPGAPACRARKKSLWLSARARPSLAADGDGLRLPMLEAKSEGEIGWSLAGDADDRAAEGWYHAELGGRWTKGATARLLVDVRHARHDLRITMTLCALVAPAAPEMEVEISANRHRIATWRFALANGDNAMHQRTLEVAAEVAAGAPADGAVELSFLIREPRSPQSLGLSADQRQLGLFVHRLTLGAASAQEMSIPG